MNALEINPKWHYRLSMNMVSTILSPKIYIQLFTVVVLILSAGCQTTKTLIINPEPLLFDNLYGSYIRSMSNQLVYHYYQSKNYMICS